MHRTADRQVDGWVLEWNPPELTWVGDRELRMRVLDPLGAVAAASRGVRPAGVLDRLAVVLDVGARPEDLVEAPQRLDRRVVGARAAVGRAGVADLDVNAVQLYLDDVLIADQGGRAASYTEQQGQAVMNRDEITIRVLLNRGQVCETVWTTDFSHDYVTINAEYRT